MQYASNDGRRVEAQQGRNAHCPVCGSPVIPRCGEIRVHHWAHRGKRNCDHWWEPETGWHRDWKGHFPEAWREFLQLAADGEKHIADIRSPSGRVIEFQHSFLNPDERRAREAFYGTMTWIVDGTRRKRDRQRFVEATSSWRNWGRHNRIFIAPFPDRGLPAEWLTSSVPVYFDFGADRLPWDHEPTPVQRLWCLLPQRPADNAVIVEISKAAFIARYAEDQPVFDIAGLVPQVVSALAERQRRAAYLPAWRRQPRRRYAQF